MYLILNILMRIRNNNEIFSSDFIWKDVITLKEPALLYNVSSLYNTVIEIYGIHYMVDAPRNKKHTFFICKNSLISVMTVEDEYWMKYSIYADENQTEAIQELILVGFYSYMSLRQTLLMHASAVSWNGQGLVFTAPSGTGKTTQAELWARYKGAKILNGDKVFLKQETDAIHAWDRPGKGHPPTP